MRQSTIQSSLPSALAIAALLLLTIPVTAADRTDPPPNVATDGFRFNHVDTPFKDILEEFSKRADRILEGSPPEDQITLDCGREVMTFELALARVTIIAIARDYLVFQRKDRATIEIGPRSTYHRHAFPVGLNSIFIDVESFAQSVRDGGDFAMLLQDCRHSAPTRIVENRKLVPTYVMLAPYPNKQCLTVFAAAADIRLYAPLLDMLDIALQDPTTVVAEIKLVHTEPDTLADTLMLFFPTTVTYRRLGKERQTEPADSVPLLRVWTDWAHRRAVVTGSPSAVAQAKSLAQILEHTCFPIAVRPPTDPATSGLQSPPPARR